MMTMNKKNIMIIIWGENVIIEMTMRMTQVMREEGLEQVTGLSCGSGDNQMVRESSNKRKFIAL